RGGFEEGSAFHINLIWETINGLTESGGEKLHVTEGHRPPQRRQRIGTVGNKFLRDVAFEAGRDYRLHDARPVQLLRLVNFRAARHAARVIVVEVLMV